MLLGHQVICFMRDEKLQPTEVAGLVTILTTPAAAAGSETQHCGEGLTMQRIAHSQSKEGNSTELEVYRDGDSWRIRITKNDAGDLRSMEVVLFAEGQRNLLAQLNQPVELADELTS